MKRKPLAAFCLAAALGSALGAALGAAPARAQLMVFDPSNYAQNLLTAARAPEQVNNQIKSLQNEAAMIENMAKTSAARFLVAHANDWRAPSHRRSDEPGGRIEL